MGFNYSSRVKYGISHITKNDRLGEYITYYRFRDHDYDPETGFVDVYYEWPSFYAMVHSVTAQEIEDSGGRIEFGDIKMFFGKSEFTDQSDTYAGDPVRPQSGDLIIHDGNRYKTNLGDNDYIYEIGPSNTSYSVYARRTS